MPAPHALDEALDQLDREYVLGAIDREQWSTRHASRIASFAERGISEEPDDEPDNESD